MFFNFIYVGGIYCVFVYVEFIYLDIVRYLFKDVNMLREVVIVFSVRKVFARFRFVIMFR